MKKYLRIILPIFLLAIACIYLYSAAYSAWAAYGPPSDYPDAWAFRSFRHFFYGIGFIIFAATVFISLKANAKRKKAKCIIGVILALCMFSTPHIKKFLEIDGCLDQGGRWNEDRHICEK
jgi:cell division protein FtsW (lipid II flippase)